jgi:hypothetical protein
MRPRLALAVWLGGVLLGGPAALACPVCDSATGEQVRAGILGAGFAPTFWAVLAPFPLLLLSVAAIHYWLVWLPGAPAKEDPP